MFAVSKAAQAVSSTGAVSSADAIDFDGTNDYLSRSTDLVGNADGKTFTFSCWVYPNELFSGYLRLYAVHEGQFFIRFETTTNILTVYADVAGVPRLQASIALILPIKTLSHLLISCDMASTSNRAIYVNDVAQSVTWTTYSNSSLDFTGATHWIGSGKDGSFPFKGRLSHVFLAYEYVDLSVEANRRIFITADRKPALNQQALNPILYLPLNDPTQPGKNLGTGGDFTLTGVVARSGRGPSQFNASYSDLDGSADYLRHSGSMCANGKQMTVSVCFNADTISNTYFFHYGDNTASGSVIALQLYSGEVGIFGTDGGAYILHATAQVKAGRNYHLLISVDMSDPAKRHFVLNGNANVATWSNYTNANFAFSQTSQTVGAGWSGSPGLWMDGKVGHLWFHNSYIDLSQPANLAKFITGTGIDAKPADLGANGELPFGTPPLIYLPMYGNNAGKNYGTGGDFTVNSGPYPGARGPNEFWGNKADFDGSTGYLSRSASLGMLDSNTLSGSFWVSPDTLAEKYIMRLDKSSGGVAIYVSRIGTGYLEFVCENAAGSSIVIKTATTTVLANGGSYGVQFCINLSIGVIRCYVNNIAQSFSGSPLVNDYVSLSYADRSAIAGMWSGSSYVPQFDGKLSEFYFTTDYIDFSQEANRLKFRDAFGNPVDLTPQIAAGTLPNPAIYLRFAPDNFGKNSGTGGDFTVNGTITDGGQL